VKDVTEFEAYLDELCEPLGQVKRRVGLRDDTHGLLLPLERKSMEPLAAHLDPDPVSAKHQSLHHFATQAAWSDEAVLAKVRAWGLPELNLGRESDWVVDDTGLPKKGQHSVGVAHPYCGPLGKQAHVNRPGFPEDRLI
jgi:SRSO17 transposase